MLTGSYVTLVFLAKPGPVNLKLPPANSEELGCNSPLFPLQVIQLHLSESPPDDGGGEPGVANWGAEQ